IPRLPRQRPWRRRPPYPGAPPPKPPGPTRHLSHLPPLPPSSLTLPRKEILLAAQEVILVYVAPGIALLQDLKCPGTSPFSRLPRRSLPLQRTPRLRLLSSPHQVTHHQYHTHSQHYQEQQLKQHVENADAHSSPGPIHHHGNPPPHP